MARENISSKVKDQLLYFELPDTRRETWPWRLLCVEGAAYPSLGNTAVAHSSGFSMVLAALPCPYPDSLMGVLRAQFPVTQGHRDPCLQLCF